jgi:hypothetical protein
MPTPSISLHAVTDLTLEASLNNKRGSPRYREWVFRFDVAVQRPSEVLSPPPVGPWLVVSSNSRSLQEYRVILKVYIPREDLAPNNVLFAELMSR